MTRLELSADDARRLREVLTVRLRTLSTEINRTEQLEMKASLRQTERLLDRLVQQLGETAETVM